MRKALANPIHGAILGAVVGTAVGIPSDALALDPAIELGVQGGVFVVDPLDQINTSWYAAPKIDIWFVPSAALEIDVGFSTGGADVPEHGFFAAMPTLSFVGNPLASKGTPVQPIVQLGAGVMYKSINDKGIQGADYANTRVEAIVSFGTGFIIPIPKTPINLRFDAKVWVSVAEEDGLYDSPFIHFVGTGGLGVKLGLSPDEDKDKVPDNKDLCPTDPEDIDGFEDADGCPDPDNDADGVLDDADQCGDEAEDLDGFEDDDGCPDVDNDADGLSDAEDVCPDVAGPDTTGGCPDGDGDGIADAQDLCPTAAGLPDFDGCPDTDGDLVADPDDECPDEAGTPESFGCPDQDADHVPDARDACPDEQGPLDADATRHDGCPAAAYYGTEAILLSEGLQFSRNSASLSRDSRKTLDQVAALIKGDEAIEKVVVEYTVPGDDTSLAQKRAAAVVVYLMDSAGVPAAVLKGTSSGGAASEAIYFKTMRRVEKPMEPVVEAPAVTDEAPAETDEAPAAE